MTGHPDAEVDHYLIATPESRKLQKEASRYLPGGSSRGAAYFEPYPFFVDHAEGHYVYDVDGNRYLDFMINATTYIAGHANPMVVKAVQDQAARGLSYSAPTQSQIRLAKILCDRVPSVEIVRFTNSGTEGTLNAIQLSRAATGRHKIAKFEGGYHGAHEYVSVSVYTSTDHLDPDGPKAISEMLGQPPKVLEDVVVMAYNSLESAESLIREHAEDLACVIMEPVLSNIGYVAGNPEFLQGIREITQELGIILIYDEVQSFRLSIGGAQQYFGVTPDITTFGKIIGGGMPVGAWGGRSDLMALYNPDNGPVLSHTGTFNANPMTMVAGEATLMQLTPELYERLNRLGEMLREKLRAVFAELDVPAQVTGVGSLFGIHFSSEEITDYRSMLRGDQGMKKRLFRELLNQGVLMQTRAAGALNIHTTSSEIDSLVDAIRTAVQRITS